MFESRLNGVCVTLFMDAKELQRENRRLEKAPAKADAKLNESAAQHQSVVAEFLQTIEDKDRKLTALQRQIAELLKQIRGSRQEVIDPDQLMLFSVDELQQLADEIEQRKKQGEESDSQGETPDAKPNEKSKRKGHGRRPLPSHLQREVLRHELSDQERLCPCCGELRAECGVESSEQLEYVPAKWKVIQHDRVKYACRACQENVSIAVKPPQPIEKGLPGPGLCAHTTLSKFGDHQPLYRQEDIHSRTGLSALAVLSEPLVMRMKHLLLESKVIHTDDTKIKMLQPGVGIAKEAKFWPYLGDWLHPYAVYDFTLDRSREGPQNFLGGYSGYLQADAYGGYDCIYAPGEVREVACWMHARRYWHKIVDLHPQTANTALGYIARLCQIEEELRRVYPKTLTGERDFEAVAAERQRLSLPILAAMKVWLDELDSSGRILPKSELRTALGYTLNQWSALCRYTQAGYLSMENNVAERLVKVAAMGRKNYLFVGNETGGRNAALHYSMVSSAKVNGVEPFAWLSDVYRELPQHRGGEAFSQATAGESVTSTELDYLLPDRWLTTHRDSAWKINEIRRKERASAEQRKRRKLLKRKRG